MDIAREKVLEREGKPARFLGMTIGEMVTLILILFVSNSLSGNRMVTIGAIGAYLTWIKKVRDFVPEGYFKRMFAFYWMPFLIYRAGSRHAEWRHHIKRD